MQYIMKVLKSLLETNMKISAEEIVIKDNNNKARMLSDSVIIESGSNNNGSWVKWSDGTMECYKTIRGTIDISTAWGSMYTSANLNLGSTPQIFIERPTITVSPQTQTGTQYILTGTSHNNSTDRGTVDNFGGVCLVRPNSRTAVAYILDVRAIGRWK